MTRLEVSASNVAAAGMRSPNRAARRPVESATKNRIGPSTGRIGAPPKVVASLDEVSLRLAREYAPTGRSYLSGEADLDTLRQGFWKAMADFEAELSNAVTPDQLAQYRTARDEALKDTPWLTMLMGERR